MSHIAILTIVGVFSNIVDMAIKDNLKVMAGYSPIYLVVCTILIILYK